MTYTALMGKVASTALQEENNGIKSLRQNQVLPRQKCTKVLGNGKSLVSRTERSRPATHVTSDEQCKETRSVL